VLEDLPANRRVHLDLGQVKAIDHTTAETLGEWLSRRRQQGHAVTVSGPEPILRAVPHAG
jgi:ABC-type transporter Mla MlaB component